MNNVLILIISMCLLFGCEDNPHTTSDQLDLSYCFSPEFGISEAEQFFYSLQLGELVVDLNINITSRNIAYSIEDGSNLIFIYKHFLENSFMIEDDEVEIRMLFQIDEGLSSFEVDSVEEFQKLNFVYAECGIALQTVSGNMTGGKDADGNWKVEADLKVQRFSQVREISINETFKF